jgi:hypothetical protein
MIIDAFHSEYNIHTIEEKVKRDRRIGDFEMIVKEKKMTTKLALMLALFVGVCYAQDTTKTTDKLVLSRSALTSELNLLVNNYQDLEKHCEDGEKQIAAWKETMRQIEGGVSTLRRFLTDRTLLYVEPKLEGGERMETGTIPTDSAKNKIQLNKNPKQKK